MATGTITKRAVDAFNAGERQALLWDTRLKGFGLLAMPSGSKSYVYQYRLGGRGGATRRYTIGKHGSPWSPDQARVRAEELAGDVRRGIDPLEAERAAADAKRSAKAAAEDQALRMRELAFADYAERFLDLGLRPGTRERTREGYASALRRHVVPVFGSKALPELAKADVVRVLDRIPANQPSVRRIVFAVMRMLFNWAKGRGDVAANPMEGLAAPSPVTSRDRVLADAELALAIRAAGDLDKPFGAFYRILFATGQRREEVAGLDWAELDRKSATWTLPAERSKNGQASIVPLNRHALAALDAIAGVEANDSAKWPRRGLVLTTTGRTPISGYSRAKARLDAAMLKLARNDAEEAGEDQDSVTLAPWRLHDARRTLATAMQRLGVRFEVTEAILNHTAGASRSGVAAVYQRHNWADEKRAALDAWADFVDRLFNPADQAANVVPLRPATSSPGRAR